MTTGSWGAAKVVLVLSDEARGATDGLFRDEVREGMEGGVGADDVDSCEVCRTS